jgi:hypothetical protein
LHTEGLLKNLFIAGREFLEELHEGDVVLLADLQNLDVLALVLFWRIVTEIFNNYEIFRIRNKISK